MVIQNEELKSFLAQTATSSGKKLCFVTCDRVDSTIAYAAEFCNKKARQEA